jgi:hypothetical protein
MAYNETVLTTLEKKDEMRMKHGLIICIS